MPNYIVLFRFTDQGRKSIKQTPLGLDMNKQALLPAMGVQLKQVYFVTGRYDGVAILEAPNEDAVARAVLTIGSMGNLRTETLRAFTEQEFLKIVEDVP